MVRKTKGKSRLFDVSGKKKEPRLSIYRKGLDVSKARKYQDPHSRGKKGVGYLMRKGKREKSKRSKFGELRAAPVQREKKKKEVDGPSKKRGGGEMGTEAAHLRKEIGESVFLRGWVSLRVQGEEKRKSPSEEEKKGSAGSALLAGGKETERGKTEGTDGPIFK